MDIETIVATAQLRRKKVPITYDCQHIQIVRSSPVSISGALRTALQELITVTMTDTNNQPIELTKRVPLGAHAVREQLGAGYIYERQTGLNTYECTVSIRLANVGIHIPPGGKIHLLLDDMIVGATYTVSVLEVPITGDDYTEAVVIPSTDNQERTTLYMAGNGTLVIPALPSIQGVRLHYSNGKTFDYTSTEIKQINALTNDVETWSDRLSILFDVGKTAPATAILTQSRSSEFLVVSMANVIRVDIDTDGTAMDVYQFLTKQLPTSLQELRS